MTAPGNYNRDRGPATDTGVFAQAVRNGIDKEFIQWAEGFGRDIARSVTTSQIRNIYGTVKKIEMAGEIDLPAVLLLKPRIAYAAHRNKGMGAELAPIITQAIDAVADGSSNEEKQERFQRFSKGFEAIVAYHRAAGGK
ncbi:MAG: type III-A CRISPR-associated protein Csm2 [Candidatus Hydrogenedentes bacterium]|nr:type III-A CRISPR-associated protein Csm2 [Candidatus Hydrogenedentota bacterium]